MHYNGTVIIVLTRNKFIVIADKMVNGTNKCYNADVVSSGSMKSVLDVYNIHYSMVTGMLFVFGFANNFKFPLIHE